MSYWLLLLFVGFGLLVTAQNWRYGIFFMILIGAVQDPIRKITPGVPVYLVLSSFPIWALMLFSSITGPDRAAYVFRIHQPRLFSAMQWFALCLFPAALVSATYGPGSWRITLLGILMYASPLFGIMVGFSLPRTAKGIDALFKMYCLVTAVALVGVLLEHQGLFRGWKALGTEALNTVWFRHKPGYIVYMKAGFYRSPDIMGWHAAAMIMLALTLAILRRGAARLFWILVAGWGAIGVMLCGRRKMIMMVPVFIAVLIWVYWRNRSGARVLQILLVLVIAAAIGVGLTMEAEVEGEVGRYYFEETGDTFDRVFRQGILGAFQRLKGGNFVFGRGLGMASQAVHHVKAKGEEVSVEAGLAKIATEMGLLGLIGFLYLAFHLLRAFIREAAHVSFSTEQGTLFAALVGFSIANAASFIVSGHVYTDPFINCFLALLIGMSLASVRLGEAGHALPRIRYPSVDPRWRAWQNVSSAPDESGEEST